MSDPSVFQDSHKHSDHSISETSKDHIKVDLVEPENNGIEKAYDFHDYIKPLLVRFSDIDRDYSCNLQKYI